MKAAASTTTANDSVQSSSNTSSNNSTTGSKIVDSSFSQPSLPDWLIKSSPAAASEADHSFIKLLQDELSRTKELLIDQQTSYLQLQTQSQQQTHEFNGLAAKMFAEFQALLKQSLLKQRELLQSDFKQMLSQQQADLERKFQQQIKDSLARYEAVYVENMETKLAEYQEQLIKHNESEYQDIEMKIKLLVAKMFKDEQEKERGKLKQTVDTMEKEIKASTEKYVKSYFMSQSELFKDQIKSGVLQEHLIHKDLINSKLEKLFRDSEEKRRQANLLFARHVSSFNFFVSNAQKQLGVLKEAHVDLFKNKELIDYYGKTMPSTSMTANLDDVRKDEPDDLLIDHDNLELPLKSISHLSLSAISTTAANQSELRHQIPLDVKKPDDSKLFDDHLFDEL